MSTMCNFKMAKFSARSMFHGVKKIMSVASNPNIRGLQEDETVNY